MPESRSYFRIYNAEAAAPVSRPPFSIRRFMRRVAIGLALEITVTSLGLVAYFMIMLSGLSIAEKTVMGFRLEAWHAFVFAFGYALTAFLLFCADVKTPLALIARIAAAVASSFVRLALPLIIMMGAILWLMAIPSHGFLNPALGTVVWFVIVSLPGFGAFEIDL